MVTQVIRYRASDGSEWRSVDGANQRDKLIREVVAAMACIPEVDVPGEKYFQHDKESLMQARRNLFAIVRREFAWFLKDDYPDENGDNVPPSGMVGRVVSDSDLTPLVRAWGRLSRCNFHNFREYQQVYFANHPDQASTQM